MATEQITDDELLALHALANTSGGVKLGSSVLLRLLNTVAALRAQLAERCVVGPDVVTVPREEWEALRELEHQAWSALDEVENHGECDMTGISGAYKAVKESIALRSGEVVATPQDTVAVPKFESYHIPSFVRFPDGGYRGSFDYGFRRGWQKLASLLGDKGAIEAEKAQSKSDSWSEWDQLNRESGVGQ